MKVDRIENKKNSLRFLISLFFIALSFSTAAQNQIPPPKLATGWYFVRLSAPEKGIQMSMANDTVKYCVDIWPILTAKKIADLKVYDSSGHRGLYMRFNEQGKSDWYEGTIRSISNHMAFIVDGVLVAAPFINNEIENGVAIIERPDISKEALLELKSAIEKNIRDELAAQKNKLF